jgi:hypothetical protein
MSNQRDELFEADQDPIETRVAEALATLTIEELRKLVSDIEAHSRGVTGIVRPIP